MDVDKWWRKGNFGGRHKEEANMRWRKRKAWWWHKEKATMRRHQENKQTVVKGEMRLVAHGES